MAPVMQSGPNVSWLDDELRKQKAVAQELREVIGKQQVTLVDQNQRIQTLEAALAKLTGQLARIPDVEEALEHTRDDLVLRLAEMHQDQQKSHTEFLRNRQAERELDTRAIQELRIELQRLTAFEQGLAVQHAETTRLNETIMRLQQSIDDLEHKLVQVEDNRRQLGTAIEKNTVTASRAVARIEEVAQEQKASHARLLVLEATIAKLSQQTTDLQSMREEITDQQDELLEAQRRADQARVQTMTEWGRRLEAQSHQLEVWADQLRFFGDQHEKNRRVLREVQELAQEVSQQQDRLRQLQRVAEEQIRRELREWQSESDQRWTQLQELRESDLAAAGKQGDTRDKRLHDLESHLQGADKALAQLRGDLVLLRQVFENRAVQSDDLQQRAWTSLAKALAKVSLELGDATPKEGA